MELSAVKMLVECCARIGQIYLIHRSRISCVVAILGSAAQVRHIAHPRIVRAEIASHQMISRHRLKMTVHHLEELEAHHPPEERAGLRVHPLQQTVMVQIQKARILPNRIPNKIHQLNQLKQLPQYPSKPPHPTKQWSHWYWRPHRSILDYWRKIHRHRLTNLQMPRLEAPLHSHS